ncbi:hypothetical protein G647_01560 [Cladophialophora carrionii CBS 160.54]|uniref:Uncharacterized protein n=1 Tax=Cladophialophora carrionii CBS 160.54 TaxID=1279043 RepID=V9DT07_9EURO|nr:uncharacterized protein G647_01560 [Cladophialophora carrionii CBS 160.54]ETI29107.1 hypothetical protein G647_01560 [Cladophialophora carrionii CBS 160.54]
MPPGGRPPRGRPGRNNDRFWELQQQQRSWDYDARVEELDTDDDYSPQGVELDQNYGQGRYRSDELRFTGIDLGGGMVRRRRSGDVYTDDFTPSDDEEEFEYDLQSGLIRRPDMQVAYKEKEELLVQRAEERIARARALGKPNVKLSRAEIDALERSARHQNPPHLSAAPKTVPKSKKEAPVVKRKPIEVRKGSSGTNARSVSDSPHKGKSGDSRSRGKNTAGNDSARASRENSVAAQALPPADPDYDRRLPYPQGSNMVGARQIDRSWRGPRTNSNQSLRQLSQVMPPLQHPYYTNRYSSNPDVVYSNRPGSNSSRSSRPDPSEVDWEPRARSASSLVNVPLDQLPYQTNVGRAPRFDPSDPRFASPQRRVASGTMAGQNQAARYRRPQDELFLPPDGQPEVYNYLTPGTEDDNDDDDDDSDYDAGVQVNVTETPGGNYTIQTRSATAAASSSSSHKQKGNGKSTAGKNKKGR